MVRRHLGIVYLAGACGLLPAAAGAVSLVVDHPNTPDVVQAGDTVSFSFAFQLDRDEALLATQAEISAPHLRDFQFTSNSGIKGSNPWDLSSTFRRIGPDADGNLFNPMWVHAENVFDDDPKGVTWDEVGGLAPLGTFSAIATYNGEIVFDLSSWVLSLFNGPAIPINPTWAHYQTGVTIVGGANLPPAPPPVPSPPSTEPPPQQTAGVPLPISGGIIASMLRAVCGVNSIGSRTCLGPGLFPGVSGIDASAPVSFIPAERPGVEGAVPEPPTSTLMLLVSSLVFAHYRASRR